MNNFDRKEYYKAHKETIKKQSLEHYKKNRKGILERQKEYAIDNKGAIRAYKRQYYVSHRDTLRRIHAEYYKTNKNAIKKMVERYRVAHVEKVREASAVYRATHLDYYKSYIRVYSRLRTKRDADYKVLCYLRTRIWFALKGKNKSQSTMQLVGCTIEFLKTHLAKQFKKGMNWKNYGKWHVDHKRPCASFDLSKPKEQLKCFNYRNLQPLWAEENMRKGSKVGRVR